MTVGAAVFAALVALATFAALRYLRVQPYYWAADELLHYIGVDATRYDYDAQLMCSWVPERVIDYALSKDLTLTFDGPDERPFWVIASAVIPWRSVHQRPMAIDWKLIKETS